MWYLLVDLDELPELDGTLRGFGYDRASAVSFHTRDHGARDGSPLRPWIERHLATSGIDLDGGAIRLLTFPRVMGYVFNPLSVWFCHHRDGSLRAILYEVSNTSGETHAYLVPADEPAMPGTIVRRAFDKELFVSPFIDLAARYDFATRVPDDRLSVVVRETVAEGPVLIAALTSKRVPLTSRSLARAFFELSPGHAEGDRRDPLGSVEALGEGHALQAPRSPSRARCDRAPAHTTEQVAEPGGRMRGRVEALDPPAPCDGSGRETWWR